MTYIAVSRTVFLGLTPARAHTHVYVYISRRTFMSVYPTCVARACHLEVVNLPGKALT